MSHTTFEIMQRSSIFLVCLGLLATAGSCQVPAFRTRGVVSTDENGDWTHMIYSTVGNGACIFMIDRTVDPAITSMVRADGSVSVFREDTVTTRWATPSGDLRVDVYDSKTQVRSSFVFKGERLAASPDQFSPRAMMDDELWRLVEREAEALIREQTNDRK